MNSDDRYANVDSYAAEAEVKCLAKLLSRYGLGQTSDRQLKVISRSYALQKGLLLRKEHRGAKQSVIVIGPDNVRLITAYGHSSSGALRNLMLWIFQQEDVSSLTELEIKLDLEARKAL